MSTNVVVDQLARLLYQKGAFGGTIFLTADEKKILDDKDPMLRLHQSLAAICARATKRGGTGYVVATEVVACHIHMPDLPTQGSQKLGAKVWLCKNTEWDERDKKYVNQLLGSLRDIGNQFTESTIHGSGRLPDLTTLIYGYCKDKVWSRLGKLVDAINQGDKSHTPSMRVLKPKLELWLKLYEEFQSQDFGLWKLADASNFCRKFVGFPEEDGTPLISKRLKKVGSYSASFNNLVTWALGARSYASYSPIFLDPQQVGYSHPITRKMDAFKKDTLTAHFFPVYSIPDATQREQRLAALQPLPPAQSTAQAEIFVHAEMHMAPSLAHNNTLKGQQYIGISKPCCFLCYNAINALRGHDKIVVKGTHNKLYPKWMIPPSNQMDREEVKLLEKELDNVITKQILHPQTYPPTADTIHNSQNTDDLDLQPQGPLGR